jgi:hypothetical protein
MNSSDKKYKIIRLTKIRQWYLPVDAESYNILKDAGVAMLRIHENFLPTIGLLTKKRKIKARSVPFNESILHPYLDELGSRWQAKEFRKATINASVLKFETTHASIHAKSKEVIEKLEASLRRFFTRWGYAAMFEYSESRGKCKLHVTYKYDSTKLPVIPLVEDSTSLPTITLELGHIRVRLTMGMKYVETNISEATGNSWTSVRTSRCLYSQISDVRPFINALMRVTDNDPHNFDNLTTR